MRKFHFRLESVERHRKLKEQERQVWLAKCMERLRATEARLLDLDMKEVQARRDFAGLGSLSGREVANPAKFWLLDQFIQGQKIRRVDLKQQLMADEQEAALAYQEFLKARQQRKIMEKLRERRLEQFKEDFRKEEGRRQDEQYVMRARLAGKEIGDADEEE